MADILDRLAAEDRLRAGAATIEPAAGPPATGPTGRRDIFDRLAEERRPAQADGAADAADDVGGPYAPVEYQECREYQEYQPTFGPEPWEPMAPPAPPT